MAIILRGKRKREKVEISQFCNDWVSIKGDSKIFGITQLSFSPEELTMIRNQKDNGFMFELFYIDGDRFKMRRLVKRRMKNDL